MHSEIEINISRWRECREKGILLHSWWECKLEQPLWRTGWRFLKKTNRRATMSVCMLSHFSVVPLFAALWTGTPQAPLSSGFSRQEYWSGLPCPAPGHQTCVSFISCTGRQVLYHWCHLGSLRTTIWPCDPIAGHISGEKHLPKGYMYPNVHCSIVYNSQDMEAT